MTDIFDFDPRLLELAQQAEKKAAASFAELAENAEYNSAKVLKAFIDNRVSESCMKGTTGYGYGDIGRETLDAVYAQALGGEDAVVRHTFVNGTHALSTALFGVLRPGDEMLSLTGSPYDTMEEVIGIRGEKGRGSLTDFGVKYSQVELKADGTPDLDGIRANAAGKKVGYIQRSRGYSLRPSFRVDVIGEVIKAAREANPDIIIIVDNCYGEFVEKREPLAVGADLIVGSLIKNPGGGIASTGGYICGRKDLVELCADRLACIGAGKEVGCTLTQSREMFMGFFLAPTVVEAALKTSVFACALFESLGFRTFPSSTEKRTDIIASICLENEERLTAFCQGIQKGSPVDSFVSPEAWDMPGYESRVIMAAGAFTMGASIELSADAPIREPFAAWLQGGITYPSGKIGILTAAQELINKGLAKL
ncbi:Cystathionine beta-lyase family protein involved in aluminum resistance [Ruminococcus sp. YE71]|uniref:methionine gamma-lyase family protein n=1 Tax=unclassified Ruminococcus TaxID=2608920 RepID=UPI000886951A|nr:MULTISPECIES: methionine gamma-lyase family protein [unclassified Ruminococcus]SDA23825.1 Cystathionine beta-lyase family protein involved in aluminum resistance [Ruminococcus sp. YE78]SFW40576.1 Cystathionine beta-lyase family protein involved in aluminum resistance [Ruminococcus sp. YE71]